MAESSSAKERRKVIVLAAVRPNCRSGMAALEESCTICLYRTSNCRMLWRRYPLDELFPWFRTSTSQRHSIRKSQSNCSTRVCAQRRRPGNGWQHRNASVFGSPAKSRSLSKLRSVGTPSIGPDESRGSRLSASDGRRRRMTELVGTGHFLVLRF